MNQHDQARHNEAQQEFLALRREIQSAQIATLDENQLPQSSYAPLIWLSSKPYFYLSELASHTENLQDRSVLGLILIEDQAQARNPFARRRISWQGNAQSVARESELFNPAMNEFQRRFGAIMNVILPLPDFHLFEVTLHSGRFIRGFGEAYRLIGESLETLQPIGPK